MTTVTKPKSQNLTWPIALALLVTAGVFSWVIQLTRGYDVIGTSPQVVWGIYIAAFFLLIGAGSALVIITAAGDLKLLPGVSSQRRTLLAFALGAFIAGGFAILMDIGRPARVLNLLLSANWKSPFIWDFFSLAAIVGVTLVYLYTQPNGKALPILSALVATLIIFIEGWILGVLASRSIWYGGLSPVLFFVEALAAGVACLLLISNAAQGWTRKALASLLIVAGLITLVDAVALMFSGSTTAQAAMSLMISGNLAVWFWTQVLIGIVVPVILLFGARSSTIAAKAAAILAILGLLLSKLNLLIAGQAIPLQGPAESYIPTPVELGGVLGVLAFALLIGHIVRRVLPDKAEAGM